MVFVFYKVVCWCEGRVEVLFVFSFECLCIFNDVFFFMFYVDIMYVYVGVMGVKNKYEDVKNG